MGPIFISSHRTSASLFMTVTWLAFACLAVVGPLWGYHAIEHASAAATRDDTFDLEAGASSSHDATSSGAAATATVRAWYPTRTLAIACVLLLCGGTAFVWAFARHPEYLGSRSLSVERLQIPLDKIPVGSKSLTILHLSDIHFHEDWDVATARQMRRVVEFSKGVHPDVIVVSGDLVDFAYRHSETLAQQFLAPLASSARLGTFACLGNHDLAQGAAAVPFMRNVLRNAGITLLVNETVMLQQEPHRDGVVGFPLSIAGVGDLWSSFFKPAQALVPLQAGDPSPIAARQHTQLSQSTHNSPVVVLLSHNPDSAPKLLPYDVDLLLAGHTHGGQICLPFNPWGDRPIPVLRLVSFVYHNLLPRFVRHRLHHGVFHVVRNWQWAQGLHRLARQGRAQWPLWMYVSRGLADVHRRLFCNPEITLLTLLPGASTGDPTVP